MALVVRLAWSYPANPAVPVDKFLIKRKLAGGNWFDLAGNLPPTQTTYDDATVGYGNTYVYQIVAQNNLSGSSENNIEKTVVVTLPPPDPVPDFTTTPMVV